MKKSLSKFVSLITAVAVSLFVSSGSLQAFVYETKVYAAETTVIYGDVNNDNQIDVFDLSMIKREILNPGTSIDLIAADVNADGIVDVKDALEVQNYLLCRITAFSGTIKNAFNSIDRTIVTTSLNGNSITGDETQLTSEMAALTESLGTPAEVFKYVLNNVDTEFYYGSRKGAIGTYEQNGGSDYDQASLLIAMLRYLGYTANYAIGEVVFTEENLINMTGASDIDSAIRIFTSQGKTLTSYETGGYLTEQAMVYLELNEESQVFLDPSFKYCTLENGSIDPDKIMNELYAQYDLTDETLSSYAISKEIDERYGTVDIMEAFPRYKIIPQEIDNALSHDVPSGQVEIYTAVPSIKSDVVTLTLGGAKIYQKKSCFLYSKELTIEYEFTETAAEMMYDMYGYDSIDDLTGNLGAYTNYAQIYGVVKLDGEPVANGNSNILGTKETLQIDITSAGNTRSYEKELTFGALYSVIFDYQIISPHDIASGYSNLPQTAAALDKITESNVYGSQALMDTLTLLGKTYYSQIDTNNAMLAGFSNIYYERMLSIAIVDFTPDIYTQLGYPRLNKQGKIGIDVIANQTIFTSRSGDLTEEAKIKHSSGYLSSFYESEVLEQFSGLQTVSTAEVLNRVSEEGIDILYLSQSNIDELESSSLSTQNKSDITELLNQGMFVTVPSSEITIDGWSGTGYIVYDPITGSNSYIINNNLNGGSICSWVGLAYLCDILATVVECTWAFDVVMAGAFLFGTGLIMLTGPISVAAIAVTAIGLGVIVAGGFYIKDVGDRLYESTELMNAYLDGNADAGDLLTLRVGFHVLFAGIGTVGASVLSKPASNLFSKFHLDQRAGTFFSNAFSQTPGGCSQALEILNRISPKYTSLLTDLTNLSGNGAADYMSNIYETEGIEEVEKVVEVFNDSSLKYNGDGTWTSSEGIIYGQGSKQGNRVLHVLEHTTPNPNKPTRTVFNVDKAEVIGLIDEAWINKGSGTLQGNGNVCYEVDMGRIIGTNNEDTIIIITKGYTSEIITAYPKAN